MVKGEGGREIEEKAGEKECREKERGRGGKNDDEENEKGD